MRHDSYSEDSVCPVLDYTPGHGKRNLTLGGYIKCSILTCTRSWTKRLAAYNEDTVSLEFAYEPEQNDKISE
jgi:hypothetical protein